MNTEKNHDCNQPDVVNCFSHPPDSRERPSVYPGGASAPGKWAGLNFLGDFGVKLKLSSGNALAVLGEGVSFSPKDGFKVLC